MAVEVTIRSAAEADAEAIAEIYNHYIVDTHVTFDVTPHTPDERVGWLRARPPAGRHQVVVAETATGVVGFAASGPYREKEAYETSVETTVVLHPDALGHGTGERLLVALLDRLRREDVHRAYARIALPNDPSVALHDRVGFRTVGVEDEVGRKLGRFWSVQVMELRLERA